MRSTTERIKLAKKQADEIKKQRNEKRHRLAVISCYSFGIALIVVISALVCNLNFAGFEHTPMHDTASIIFFSVKRTFAIRFRYLLMNAVALRPVSGSF